MPTFELRRYKENGGYLSGIRFYTEQNEEVNGYPKQHTANAIQKNKDTQRRFKRLTRIFKRIRFKMKDDNVNFPVGITSFLIECLLWNVPNSIFNDAKSWIEMIRQAIIHIYNKTKEEATCSEWGEVSELLYLFRGKRKWTVKDVNQFMVDVWNYLEFKNN